MYVCILNIRAVFWMLFDGYFKYSSDFSPKLPIYSCSDKFKLGMTPFSLGGIINKMNCANFDELELKTRLSSVSICKSACNQVVSELSIISRKKNRILRSKSSPQKDIAVGFDIIRSRCRKLSSDTQLYVWLLLLQT